MLYDKRWDAKVGQKADKPTLQTMIAWLEMQDPTQRYSGFDEDACLMAQCFGVETSRQATQCLEGDPLDTLLSIALDGDETFGAALERARAAMRDSK